MKPLEAVVADMLDGRENDENITVEVSLLWSLVQRIERLRRIEEAARLLMFMHEQMGPEFIPHDEIALRAALEEKP